MQEAAMASDVATADATSDHKAVARSEAKRERLNARITPAAKALLERAASLEGRSVTDFVVAKAMEAAVRSIADHDRIMLTEQERDRFFAALLAPPTPSERARKAAKRSRDMFRTG
jgi:uncharacterized protein (DUF1778 family)